MDQRDIIQFNCNGLRAQFVEIKQLIIDYNPVIILLQELKMKKGTKVEFRGYTLVTKHLRDESNDSISVGFLIKDGISYELIDIPCNWMVIGINIFIRRYLSVFSYYDNQRLDLLSFNQLQSISKMGRYPAVIMGDFNAHSSVWDDNLRNKIVTSNKRDKAIIQFINETDYVLMNDGRITRISPVYNSDNSSLDLTFIHKDLVQYYDWNVADVMMGSDHLACFLISKHINETVHKRIIWDLSTTDWNKFNSICAFEEFGDETDINEIDKDIERNILKALKGSTKSYEYPFNKKRNPPWWDNDLNNLRKEKNKALTRYIHLKSRESLIELKKSNALYRRSIREKKSMSWDLFVEELNENLDSKELWNRVRKVRGLNIQKAIPQMKDDQDEMVDNPEQIVEIIASFFKKVSSKDSLNSAQKNNYLKLKDNCTHDFPNMFPSLEEEFSFQELEAALSNTHDSAPGPDGFKYKIFKKMSSQLKTMLLKFYNRIWKESIRPLSWRQSNVIPFIKPNFNFTPDGVRPINLINTCPKLFDKMVNSRLIYSLEKSNSFSVSQYGFRQNKQTLDSMRVLDDYVKNALKKSSHVNVISFDIKKAFDSIWPEAVLKKMEQVMIGGKMFKYVKDFLAPRQFWVTNGGIKSSSYEVDMGVPQGSPLSSTLFIIAFQHILDVFQDVNLKVKFSAYADDLVIYLEEDDCDDARSQVQDVIEKLAKKGDEFGLEFSVNKTKFIHICKKTNGCDSGPFFIYNIQIPQVDELRLLGLIVHKKYLFNSHVEKLKLKLIKDYNLCKMLSGKSFEINQDTLRKIIIALSISKVKYCIEIYGYTSKENVHKIDVMLNKFKRLVLKSFCSTPVLTLTSQSQLPTFKMLLEKAAIVSYGKMEASELFNERWLNPRNVMIKEELSKMLLFSEDEEKMEFVEILMSKTLVSPQRRIGIQIYLNIFKKKKENIDISTTNLILNDFIATNNIDEVFYTDGSKSNSGVSNAVIFQENTVFTEILHPESSIFTAEAKAILFAVKLIKEKFSNVKCAIVTDSLSVLEELKSVKNKKNEVTARIIEESISSISFIWVPSHSNIRGNELADEAATRAFQVVIDEPYVNNKLFLSDFKWVVKKNKIKQAQEDWNFVVDNKYRNLHPKNSYEMSWPISKFDQKSINRLRAGHTYLTHSHLMNKINPPICKYCDELLSVEHMFECEKRVDFSYKTLSRDGDWKIDLFDGTKFDIIKNFLKVNDYYYLI